MIGKEKLTDFAETAFTLMEGEAPQDATIGACVLICEVRIKHGSEESTAFYMHSTDRRGWVQRALLEEAQQVAVFEA